MTITSGRQEIPFFDNFDDGPDVIAPPETLNDGAHISVRPTAQHIDQLVVNAHVTAQLGDPALKRLRLSPVLSGLVLAIGAVPVTRTACRPPSIALVVHVSV